MLIAFILIATIILDQEPTHMISAEDRKGMDTAIDMMRNKADMVSSSVLRYLLTLFLGTN